MELPAQQVLLNFLENQCQLSIVTAYPETPGNQMRLGWSPCISKVSKGRRIGTSGTTASSPSRSPLGLSTKHSSVLSIGSEYSCPLGNDALVRPTRTSRTWIVIALSLQLRLKIIEPSVISSSNVEVSFQSTHSQLLFPLKELQRHPQSAIRDFRRKSFSFLKG